MDDTNKMADPGAEDIRKSLPFARWLPPLAGMVLGVVLRLIFSGDPRYPYSAMDSSFILLAPLAVGAVTVYWAERSMRRSWGYYIMMPAFANLLFVAGTLAILIEGWICAILIAPLFALVGAVGGLLMGAICRVTAWPRNAAYAFVVAPLVLGAIPVPDDPVRHVATMERTVLIGAPPAQIWRQLLDARDIRADEVGQAWMYRIGVPLPLSGITHRAPTGLVREVAMGKAIRFEQVATEWELNSYVRWQYRFAENSFPPGALDDHVKIGGRYFDLIDTEYSLAPQGKGTTALKIRMRYRVSTKFNWYARPVADLLIGNFEEVILNFYRARSIADAS